LRGRAAQAPRWAAFVIGETLLYFDL
jgi:hypothetical protein